MCLRYQECVHECWDSWTCILASVGGVRLPCVRELVMAVNHCVESMSPCMRCRGWCRVSEIAKGATFFGLSCVFVSDLKSIGRNQKMSACH